MVQKTTQTVWRRIKPKPLGVFGASRLEMSITALHKMACLAGAHGDGAALSGIENVSRLRTSEAGPAAWYAIRHPQCLDVYVRGGWDVNEEYRGETLLVRAAAENLPDTIRLLSSRGADPYAPRLARSTDSAALSAACRARNDECVQALVHAYPEARLPETSSPSDLDYFIRVYNRMLTAERDAYREFVTTRMPFMIACKIRELTEQVEELRRKAA
nr:hypothetical protein TetV2_00079 [Oceanusvirus sp.]